MPEEINSCICLVYTIVATGKIVGLIVINSHSPLINMT